jgi:FkbM family methyltransferase
VKLYGNCNYHAFEPVPDFYTKLEDAWKGEHRMKIHKYGIGGTDASFKVNREAIYGIATYLGDVAGRARTGVKIQIKSFDFALEQSDRIPTMVQMNCEGCEFDFLTDAVKHGWIKKVQIIFKLVVLNCPCLGFPTVVLFGFLKWNQLLSVWRCTPK